MQLYTRQAVDDEYDKLRVPASYLWSVCMSVRLRVSVCASLSIP